MKLPLINPYSLFKKKKTKTAITIFAIIVCVFLVGGGLDLVFFSVGGQEKAYLMEKPKATGLSPAAMAMYSLGFLGLMFLYWGGKDLIGNMENLKIIKLSKLRFTVSIFLIGLCVFALEFLLRIGFEAIQVYP